MNEYQQRQATKRQRLLDRANKKDNQANDTFQRAHDLVKHIPFGQPILVDHHSAARHRRTLDRSHNAMGKAVALTDDAENLRRRAEAVGSGGISSDDPEALQQLNAKLAKLEATRATIKRVNQAYRKGGWEAVAALTEVERKQAGVRMAADWRTNPQLYWPRSLSNIGANIRRIKQRIKELEAAAQFEDFRIEYAGFATLACVADNRVRVEFDQRPCRDVTRFMRQSGFVFSRQNLAWQRKLNPAGLLALKRVGRQLQTMALN